MRRSFLAVTAAALALSGCVAAVPVATVPVPAAPVVVAPPAPSVPRASRAAATRVVNVEMAKRLPGRNVAPYTACVLDNATDAEIARIRKLVPYDVELYEIAREKLRLQLAAAA